MAALFLLAPGHASAAVSVTSGWWSDVAPVAGADADGALLVQGGPGGPTAIAAVSYVPSPGEDAVGLTLQVVEGSASTPVATLRACPLTEEFQPGGGQPMAEAPTYDCDVHADAARSADGRRFEFDLSAFGATGVPGVAVLPTSPTDRVVLEVPTTDAVVGTGSDAGPEAPSLPAPEGASPSAGGGSVGDSTSSGAGTGTSWDPAGPPQIDFDDAAPAAPVEDGAGARGTAGGTGAADDAAAAAPAQSAMPTPVSSVDRSSGDGPSPVALGGFGVLAAVAAALWLGAGRAPAGDDDLATI